VQAEVPVVSVLYMPAMHAVHIADEDAAATLPYEPAENAVQAVAPMAPL
jgi:hypothetical protein